jgi:hypothetical protein
VSIRLRYVLENTIEERFFKKKYVGLFDLNAELWPMFSTNYLRFTTRIQNYVLDNARTGYL